MPKYPSSSKKKSLPWSKWLCGILFVIPNFFATLTLLQHLPRFQCHTPTQLAFITGFGVYLVMHLLLWKPVFMHVMGHELTHAFWAVILGGKIKSLLVSQQGGQVTISKTNFFIALAPYFFPLYTFLLLPIYLISIPKFYPVLAFLLGFSLAFHLALTVHSLRDRQSDIREVGIFFSLNFVYFMNLLVITLVISVIAPDVITLPQFFNDLWKLILKFLVWIWASFAHPKPVGMTF